MTRQFLLAGAAAMFLATPAIAGHCPKDAAAIDAALAKMSVSDEVKKEVMSLRDKGMEQHNAGDHRESEKTLAEGMRLLLTSMK